MRVTVINNSCNENSLNRMKHNNNESKESIKIVNLFHHIKSRSVEYFCVHQVQKDNGFTQIQSSEGNQSLRRIQLKFIYVISDFY